CDNHDALNFFEVLKMETIGFVGLGTIGGAIARNIQQAGYPMTVRDIASEAVKPLVEGGAKAVESPKEVAQNCKVVFTSLPGPREVEEVALGPKGLLEGVHDGSVYVDLSSSSPDLILKIEARFRSCGARVLDAPLIVGKKGVANKSLEVLASGSQDTYREVKSILDTFGDTVVYAGKLGNGTVIKLAHNLVRRGIGLSVGEGIVLGAKAGVDPQLLWDCMRWGLEVQLHQLVKTFSETVFKGKFDAPADFGIGLSRKDVGLATELGRRYDVPMPIAALVEQFMVQAMGRGWSEHSTASLFRLQEEAAGIEVRKNPT
ncbi:MAG: NAD(P)-dependent oxidoreductase, partial [Deltaproteobacteria bacterium]|nr:NAD(P)-dependent oxidoreductase [Deltaproteobacteria bacterium]